MSAHFSSSDLRMLADALDCLTGVTTKMGVSIESYGTSYLTMNDHVMRMHWDDARYVIEIPDETY